MLNNAVIMGRIVAAPELRTTASGTSVTTFDVAIDRRYNKQGEEKKTDFLTIVAWKSTAEFVCKYFSKGQMIAVQGYIQTRLYEDKDGNKRKAVEIVADNVSFCGSKNEGAAPDQNASSLPPAPAYVAAAVAADDFKEIPEPEDDLPF